MKKLLAILTMSIVIISCGADEDIDVSSENEEVVIDSDTSEEPDENEESTDSGELRMIEITYKLDSPPYNLEIQKRYFENDRPIIDTLWRVDQSLGYISNYEYDTQNRLVRQTQTFYDSDQPDRRDVLEFIYDSQNRITRKLNIENIDSNDQFTGDTNYLYNGNSIELSNNFNEVSIWTLENEGRILNSTSTNENVECTYQGSNLVQIDTNYRPEEKYEFVFDVTTPVQGGFDYSTLVSNNLINGLIYDTGNVADGGYEVFQENYLTGFTYSYLLNGAPEIQNVHYEYEFDDQGRLKKRIENSEFYPNRELIDYEYFYNE